MYMMEDLPARLCQTLFPLACSISLIYLAESDSGTLFFHISLREQKYPPLLCLSLWETTAKKTHLIKTSKKVWSFVSSAEFSRVQRWVSRCRWENVTLRNLQKFAVWLRSRVKAPFTFMAADFTVIPRHLLVGRSGDQLLQLRSLTDDGLLHGCSLSRQTAGTHTDTVNLTVVMHSLFI